MYYCLDSILYDIQKTVFTHRLGAGKYARWLWQNAAGNRNLSSSEYGCADAANILYTLGDFPSDSEERAACVAELRSFQHPESGMFAEPTHHPLHSTAHCTAALELFDARPLYPLQTLIHEAGTPEKLIAFLDTLPADADPWPQAHRGAGIYAAFLNAGIADLAWQDTYFSYLTDHCDAATGIGFTRMHAGKYPLQHHLNGWFHYLFNFVAARRPIPHPRALVDSLIAMYRDNAFVTKFASRIGFAEIDWVYSLHRASMQEGYRVAEMRDTLRDFAHRYLDFFSSVDITTDEDYNDLHALFGSVCTLAELQLALPGEIVSTTPLRLVLDRRPFI